jgi:hypothetical protein
MSMRIALGCVLMCLGLPTLAGECMARSGERTAALVELYTSEGCSSCPPADRWLSSLGRRGYAPERVVPLSLHVDYWDYIGWKDPHAKREFSLRQRKLTQLQRLALVYTPQVLLQGRDFRGWAGSEFDEAVARINRLPAKARISLAIGKPARDSLEVGASAELADPALSEQAALYLAAYENRLTSRVNAGENRGRLLEHDYVVLEWQGPFAFDAAGRIQVRRHVPLLPKAISAHSGVVAFVQNRRSTEVLQALMLPAC